MHPLWVAGWWRDFGRHWADALSKEPVSLKLSYKYVFCEFKLGASTWFFSVTFWKCYPAMEKRQNISGLLRAGTPASPGWLGNGLPGSPAAGRPKSVRYIKRLQSCRGTFSWMSCGFNC
jgi:hypothetical protein